MDKKRTERGVCAKKWAEKPSPPAKGVGANIVRPRNFLMTAAFRVDASIAPYT